MLDNHRLLEVAILEFKALIVTHYESSVAVDIRQLSVSFAILEVLDREGPLKRARLEKLVAAIRNRRAVKLYFVWCLIGLRSTGYITFEGDTWRAL